MFITKIVYIRKFGALEIKHQLSLDVTNNLLFPPKIVKSRFTITNPRYNKHISPVPWHFVKSSFHCINII